MVGDLPVHRGGGYRDVRPWIPPLPSHDSPVVYKGPIWATCSSQGVSSILASKTSVFTQILLSSPQIWEMSFYKTPLQRNDQFTSSTLWKSGSHTPTWKKLSSSLLSTQQNSYSISRPTQHNDYTVTVDQLCSHLAASSLTMFTTLSLSSHHVVTVLRWWLRLNKKKKCSVSKLSTRVSKPNAEWLFRTLFLTFYF